MIVKAYGKEYKVHMETGKYTNNGNLAIQLFKDSNNEPFATLTVNIVELPQRYAYLDTNNCPWAVDFVKDNNLGKFAGTYGVSGFCTYPLFKFNEEVI